MPINDFLGWRRQERETIHFGIAGQKERVMELVYISPIVGRAVILLSKWDPCSTPFESDAKFHPGTILHLASKAALDYYQLWDGCIFELLLNRNDLRILEPLFKVLGICAERSGNVLGIRAERGKKEILELPAPVWSIDSSTFRAAADSVLRKAVAADIAEDMTEDISTIELVFFEGCQRWEFEFKPRGDRRKRCFSGEVKHSLFTSKAKLTFQPPATPVKLFTLVLFIRAVAGKNARRLSEHIARNLELWHSHYTICVIDELAMRLVEKACKDEKRRIALAVDAQITPAIAEIMASKDLVESPHGAEARRQLEELQQQLNRLHAGEPTDEVFPVKASE